MTTRTHNRKNIIIHTRGLYHWGMVCESNIKANTKEQEMENSPQRDDRST